MGVEALLDALGTVPHTMAAVDLDLLLVAAAFQLLNLALRSIAWRNVLRAAYPGRRVSLVDVGCAYAAGVAVNAVVIGRGGDLAKVALARSRITGSSVPTVGATLAVTGLFDVVAGGVSLALAWRLGALPPAPHVPAPSPAVLGVAAVVLLAAVLVALRVGGRVRAALGTLRARVVQGGAVLREPRRYLTTVAVPQALGWVCRVTVVFVLLRAFGIHASLASALLVVVVGGLSTAVPSGPGGAGAQQAGVTFALQGTASAAVALTFSIAAQLGIMLLNATLGLVAAMVLFRTVRPALLRQRLRAQRQAA